MPAAGLLGEETVGVEEFWVGVDLCGPVDLEDAYDDGCVNR